MRVSTITNDLVFCYMTLLCVEMIHVACRITSSAQIFYVFELNSMIDDMQLEGIFHINIAIVYTVSLRFSPQIFSSLKQMMKKSHRIQEQRLNCVHTYTYIMNSMYMTQKHIINYYIIQIYVFINSYILHIFNCVCGATVT